MNENKRNKRFTSERRRAWKKSAKKTLKKHYVLLLVMVAIAGLIGIEKGYFVDTNSLSEGNLVSATTSAESSGGIAGQLVYGVIFNESTAMDVVDSKQEDRAEKKAERAEYDENGVRQLTDDQVINYLLAGDFTGAIKIANQELQGFKDAKTTNDVVGRKYGVLAGIANSISSGSVLIAIVESLNNIIANPTASAIIVILVALAIYVAIWVFIINVYRAIMRRIFLEARTYDKVDSSHLLFFKSVRKWNKASWTMFLYRFRLFLWSLTIIGGVIKHYSYWAVPYIVAENPGIDSKQAILLSRKMMDGRKWETFKYELTFIGWELLSACTLGILQLFFVSPYKLAADAELYAAVRQECKEDRMEGIDQLNDLYLFEKAPTELLEKKYASEIAKSADIESKRIRLEGAKRFFADNFGLWIGSDADQKEYEKYEAQALEIKEAKSCAEGHSYPLKLNHLYDPEKLDLKLEKSKSETKALNAMKSYSIWSVISLFFVFAFIGWSWEVLLHLVEDGVFVNRGTLHGPWLPIYGSGGVMILLILKRFRPKPWLEAISAVVLCGILEYVSSYYIEITKGIRYWDYTGYFLNINGRICAEGLTVFAIGGMAVVYALAPLIDRKLQKIKIQVLAPICVILVGCFVFDMIYTKSHPNTGAGITDYKHYKEVESNLLLPDGGQLRL